MYQGFSLELSTSNLSTWNSADVSQTLKQKTRDGILQYSKQGTVDAKKLEDDWFGIIQADVFISHSHADEKLALTLANGLKEKLGLTCFVDSFVWGFADELLREIDDEFCYNADKKTYSYAQRNKSTSHVHLMLCAALNKMIDRCESVIFLNTPRSLITSAFMGNDANLTASPWIYTELVATKLMRRTVPHRAGVLKKAMESVEARNLPTFVYEAPLSHMTALSAHDLKKWAACGEKGGVALDNLYDRFGLNVDFSK
ncbi:toll/interleukin-1 receptor domain-containing protein [Massilia rubra]|uniref:TIR domain-containing protein n=1 Tax=Massilia rubra TaxID=2607910 RepID=A0ABX0LPE0_9BURK|nr:toll/interleukin-1 receptor domain-containing protein [Massilia rubra]NHZ33319.1 hypothetical protein [Massilia rubra]